MGLLRSFVPGCRRSSGKPTLVGVAAGDASLPPPAPCDLSALFPWTETNNELDEVCVGDAIGVATWAVVRSPRLRPSPRAIWRGARMRELVRAGAPLLNLGCQPLDGVEYCLDVGPYPRDASDDDESLINTKETWAEAQACVRYPAGSIVGVDDGDWDTLGRYLSFSAAQLKTPGGKLALPTFAMDVFPSYQSLTSRAPWMGPGLNETSLGSHYQILIGQTATTAIVKGSWPFGQGGIVEIGLDFMRTQAFDWFVIKDGPSFPEAP